MYYSNQVDSCLTEPISFLSTIQRIGATRRNFTRIQSNLLLALLFCTCLFVPSIAVSPSSSEGTLSHNWSNVIRGGSSQATTTDTATSMDKMMDNRTSAHQMVSKTEKKIEIVFSDVDGTLVHFPDNLDELSDEDDSILKLPTSSTGMRGVISCRSMELCQELRGRNVRLILVSGMRTSTLMKRLPFLPRADAYACEAGGRIFYPVPIDQHYDGIVISPQTYKGISPQGLQPFGLKEDMHWRSKMSALDAAGTDGFTDDNVFHSSAISNTKQISQRDGLLWEFANALIRKGFAIDHKGYASCFRVNKNQQDTSKITDTHFHDLISHTIIPDGLASSVNLGCVDFYPALSGKRNCCAYLAAHFLQKDDSSESTNNNDGDDDNNDKVGKQILAEKAVCMCDDDNDLEMANACSRAYIPSITSQSMQDEVQKQPTHFIVTERKEDNIIETLATEAALQLVLESIQSHEQ